MPVSPELAANLAKATRDLYVDAEQHLLEAVARRLARGIDEPGWAEIKLIEVQALRAEVEREIARLTGEGADAVGEAVRTGYNRGAASAGDDLAAAGASRPVAFAATNTAAVDAMVQAATRTVQSTHLRILRSTMDAYRDVIAQAGGRVASGAFTRRQAAQGALDDFARRGITGFVDRAGRNWELASYAEMATRTASGQAAVTGHLDRLQSAGFDLVIVSDAPEECPLCRPWEGRVLSISGQGLGNLGQGLGPSVQVAGTMAQARASGLFHPGCRHSTGLFIPGETKPPRRTADPVRYEQRVEQRRLERGVREWKRREAVALDDDARAYARRHVRDWQGRLRSHVAEHDRKRLPYREQVTRAR